ncbi:MAG: hypothetical protein CVU05_01835 [Bacteroidetes bacterium HGW-Bacteroidetes-21]|jgi:antitoxin component YwqK of YwqJK toxin-antitoxin module|nr:MAG: hypothetical protein CVU05_01835 [Bacteroidetes bacterium HGW-Bacteroidetes-21]
MFKGILFIFAIFCLSVFYVNGQDTVLVPKTFYYETGTKSSEGFLRNGKPDGYWKAWYLNGKMRSEGNRKMFQLDSLWIFYDEDGDTLQAIDYLNGKKNGYMKTWLYKTTEDKKTGGMVSKELYLNDEKQGMSYYYEDGYLFRAIPYRDGKKHGLGKEFEKDGRVVVLLEYANDFLINRERINRYDETGKKQGVWKEFYPNDIIKNEVVYRNDTINGFVREFDKSGKITVYQKYEKGQPIVMDAADTLQRSRFVEEYYETGQIKFRGGYYDDKPVGMHKEYSVDGQVIMGKEYNNENMLIAMGALDVNDKKQGKWQYLYETGEVKAEGNFKDGKKTGEWIFWYPDKTTEQKGRYASDRPTGEWKWYFPGGKLWREELYERGKEDGNFVEYDTTGNVVLKGQYIEGEKDGAWYYHSGDHTEEGSYQDGLMEGVWKHYFLNGKLFFEGKFVQGQPDGKHIWYYENGRKKEEGNYVLGSREKKWIKYDAEGLPYLIILFKNDLEYKINGAKINLQR